MANFYLNLLTQAQKLFRHNRQGSYKTKERYQEAYKRFLCYVGEAYRLEKIANISGKHLSSYAKYMQVKNYSPSTIKTDLAAIRFWHDQIPNKRYILPSNHDFNLKQRKFGGIDRRWSNGEFNRMIAECWKVNRDDWEACIVVARYTGLRLHEVMRIDTAIARAALKDGYITIKGKGGKVREVPINDSVRIEFEKFLKITHAGHKLFVPKDKPTHIAKIELQNFINKRRKLVQDQGSTRPLTFHGLRHTVSPEWYLNQISEGKTGDQASRQVSQWLGHMRKDVTRIYLSGIRDGDKPDRNWEGSEYIEGNGYLNGTGAGEGADNSETDDDREDNAFAEDGDFWENNSIEKGGGDDE